MNFHFQLSKSLRLKMCFHWGSAKNASIPNLARQATLLTKFQTRSRNINAPWNIEKNKHQRGNNVGRDLHKSNIESNTSSWAKLSSDKTSSLRCLPPGKAILLKLHEQPKETVQLFSHQASVTCIDDVSCFHFCTARTHPSTQCPAIPVQLHGTLMNMHNENLPSISKRPWGPQ